MPIKKYWYLNEVYSDANQQSSNNKEFISKSIVDSFRLKNNKRAENQYNDRYNHQLMPKYSNFIKDKILVVIGTVKPWLEAIALDAGAGKVVILEYTRKEYEQKNMEWLQVNDEK